MTPALSSFGLGDGAPTVLVGFGPIALSAVKKAVGEVPRGRSAGSWMFSNGSAPADEVEAGIADSTAAVAVRLTLV